MVENLLYLRRLQKIGATVYLFLVLLLTGTISPIVFAAQEDRPGLGTQREEEVIIESDRQSTDSLGDIFTAFGNVRIIYPEKGIVATAQQAQYLKNEKIIVLIGDVEVVRADRDSLYGQRVVYFLDDDQFVADAKPGSQVLLKFIIDKANGNKGLSSL